MIILENSLFRKGISSDSYGHYRAMSDILREEAHLFSAPSSCTAEFLLPSKSSRLLCLARSTNPLLFSLSPSSTHGS